MPKITLDETDRRVINRMQGGFPVETRPYRAMARELGLTERALIGRLGRLLEAGVLSRFGPMYDTERLGGGLTLAAMAVPNAAFDRVAAIVNTFPEVAHNYEREQKLNMWFVVAAERPGRVPEVLDEIERVTGLRVYDMPKTAEFFLGLRLEA